MDEKQDADEGMVMNAADWQARASHIRQVLAGAPDTAVAEALGTFLFGDDIGNTWTYNGAAWMSWDGTKWSEGTVPTTVRMQPFLHEPEMAEASPDSSSMAAATADASAAPEIATGESALTASTAMTTESASSDMAASEPESAASTASMSEPEAEAEAEPAMASSSMSTAQSMSDTSTPTTELAADKAEAAWSSATPTADKPAMADAAAGSASTADIMSQPAAAAASSSVWQPQGSSMADSTAGAASTPVSAGSAASAASAAPAASSASTSAFKATHTVPAPGLGAWTKPDPSVRPEYQLAARTELMVVEMTSSGWARVAGSNGWTGWVDGRQLQPIMAAASQPVQQSWQQPAAQAQPAQQSWQQPAAQAQPAQQSWQQPATQPQPAQQSWQQPATQPQPAQQSWQQPTQPAAQAQQFRPTHTVPAMGMPAWAQPNPQLPPQANLAGGTQLSVAEWSQSGWARVVASNGWSGWVDGRMLVSLGQNPYQR